MEKLKALDLCSGTGGFSLGMQNAGFEIVGFCEKDEFCQKVLTKNFGNLPIFNDMKTINKRKINEAGIKHIDALVAGIPCQPYPTAGNQKAQNDDRDLWPEMFGVVEGLLPTWVIVENVANFINLGFTRTKVDLESIGYSVQPFTIPACAVNAQHRRNRTWIIAYLNSDRFKTKTIAAKKKNNQRIRKSHGWTEPTIDFDSEWANRSELGRAIYDVSKGLDEYRESRVKAMGNSIVPKIAEIIGSYILKVNNSQCYF